MKFHEISLVKFSSRFGEISKFWYVEEMGSGGRVFVLAATSLSLSSLSPLGKLLSSLTCSQNSVERVFSAADWAADNRERLGFEKLALEVYVRFKWLRLGGVL